MCVGVRPVYVRPMGSRLAKQKNSWVQEVHKRDVQEMQGSHGFAGLSLSLCRWARGHVPVGSSHLSVQARTCTHVRAHARLSGGSCCSCCCTSAHAIMHATQVWRIEGSVHESLTAQLTPAAAAARKLPAPPAPEVSSEGSQKCLSCEILIR